MLPACSSRVRAVCPACLRRKHRSEARPEVVETRYNCGSSHPSRHACRTGWLVAASAVHESRLSFSSIFRFPFLPFPPYFLLPLIVVLRPSSASLARTRCNSSIARGIHSISRNIRRPVDEFGVFSILRVLRPSSIEILSIVRFGFWFGLVC